MFPCEYSFMPELHSHSFHNCVFFFLITYHVLGLGRSDGAVFMESSLKLKSLLCDLG